MDKDTLMEDQTHHAVVDVGGPVGSDPSGSSGGFEPSPKLRVRIEKLAKWSINPTSVNLGNGSECHGGHATVLKSTLKRKFIGIGRLEMRDVAVKKTRLADDTDLERVLGARVLRSIARRFRKVLKHIQLTIREAEFLAGLYHENIVELEGFVQDV